MQGARKKVLKRKVSECSDEDRTERRIAKAAKTLQQRRDAMHSADDSAPLDEAADPDGAGDIFFGV